jgi:hypothetical protein
VKKCEKCTGKKVLARENLANDGPIKEPRSFKLPRRGEVNSQRRDRKAESSGRIWEAKRGECG